MPAHVVHLPGNVVIDKSNISDTLTALRISADDLGFLYRRSIDTPFCEAKYGGLFRGAITQEAQLQNPLFPEWGAVISAPFLLFCGLHMASTWTHESSLIHVISALFACNGVAAFLAHYNGWTSWHLVDQKTMLLAVWLGAGLLTNELLENSFRCCGLRGRWARAFRRCASGLVWIGVLSLYFWVTESNATMPDGDEYGFAIGAFATALPLCLGAIFIVAQLSCLDTRAVDGPNRRLARRRFGLGIAVALFGVVSWILTENLCGRDDRIGTFFRWWPGHFFWHIFMAYGTMNALIYVVALRADNFHATITIDTSSCYLAVFPGLAFNGGAMLGSGAARYCSAIDTSSQRTNQRVSKAQVVPSPTVDEEAAPGDEPESPLVATPTQRAILPGQTLDVQDVE